jgi:hypothetical protein
MRFAAWRTHMLAIGFGHRKPCRIAVPGRVEVFAPVPDGDTP